MSQSSPAASLREGSLSFIEVLATSIALIGPSMTPILIAPYMYALAGNGTWLAYVFGGTMLTFVALCINQFARRSSAAGSMYGYVSDHLGPTVGGIAGWTLLWAYGFVAAAVLGAMALFVELLLHGTPVHLPAIAIVVILATVAWQAAYRGVQISAIVMLVLEIVSVSIICLIVAIVLRDHGPSLDVKQVHLVHAFPGGIGLAIAFAVFSFVGFESATAFGAEAKRPLVTIPRAVVGSVLFASAFFVIATYAEVVGLAHAGKPLDQQTFPLGTLVGAYGIGELRLPITVAALFSAFSVCLACITTAGRVAYAMGTAGLLPRAFAGIERRHDTPNVAVTVVTAITLAVAVGALAFRVAPIDIFNNCGTLSSFGFILIYMLIAIAALVYTKRLGAMRAADTAISLLAVLFLIVPAVTLFYPVPSPPQRYFGYYFLAFLAAGWMWFRFTRASD
ncbi:MAG: APC family permease [Candidatus Eremiobacteraeota bacterium]|nr:APC family permease [Candidatus Eremiobacteraeota bacterium]MBV8499983.1 APC family permease [Candidatus Eremiobacteraeota bacterium]